MLQNIVTILAEETGKSLVSARSTTLQREDLLAGVEADDAFYIEHADIMSGDKRDIELPSDPPPDLVLEIDISSPSSRRIDIYKQLGIPELWCYSGGRVQMYRLQNGAYVPCDLSPSFPLVSTALINQFLQQAEAQDDTTFIRTWRRWIGQKLSSEHVSEGV